MKKGTKSTIGLTIKHLTERGWYADSVERWCGTSRRDLFNCIDVVAVKGGKLLALQCTAGGHHYSRLRKAKESDGLCELLKVRGSSFAIWCWTYDERKHEWKLEIFKL